MTNAMVWTTISRVMFGDTYNINDPASVQKWYERHAFALKTLKIITDTSKPKSKAKR